MEEEQSDGIEAQIEPITDQEDGFPGYTEYSSENYCGCKVVKIPSLNVTFLNEWEVSLEFPVVVTFIIMSSYFLCVCSMLPNIEDASSIWYYLISVLAFLFQYSYIRVISDGPGYLPFYYPLPGPHEGDDEGPLLNDMETSPSGIISRKEQYTWAKKHPRPNRCIVSAQARRMVIRPDHFCDWTQTWIGKRNHKFFLLFNIWGFLYIILFSIIGMLAIMFVLQSGKQPFMSCIYFLYVFIGILFAMLTGTFMCSHCSSLCDNVTSWEEWNHIDPNRYNDGCVTNCEDVCGSAKQWYCWPCPYSPWKGVTNEELLERYTVDYGKVHDDNE